MKIAFISSEVYPFAKTGGLADVSYALPKALAKKHDICIFTPLYKSTEKEKFNITLFSAPLTISSSDEVKYFALFSSDYIPGAETYFIDYEPYFGRDELYGHNGEDFSDNALRFDFLAKAVLLSLNYLNFEPDIIHCNDWHTGLIPLYLKTRYKADIFFQNIRTVFTVHNAGYQGIFPPETIDYPDFNNCGSIIENIRVRNCISFLKAGIVYSDAVTTVSRRYMQEIQTKEYGYDLANVFRSVKSRLYGITNAVDTDVWDPANDKYIKYNYSIKDLSGKTACKLNLQKLMNLFPDPDIPLIGTVSRLTFQKGMDVLADSLELLFQDEKLQFVLIGTGDQNIINKYERLKQMFPDNFGLYVGFNEIHEHMAIAGLDIYVMPSRYEPCGLNQMYSLKYGAVPVVRATGGLDDVVDEWDYKNKTGNGFKFNILAQGEIYTTLRKAIKEYRYRTCWDQIRKNGMMPDFSWNRIVQEYEPVYKSVLLK